MQAKTAGQPAAQDPVAALPRAGNWVRTRSQVLVCWDGLSEPWSRIQLDAPADFDWILFDTSGRQAAGQRQLRGQSCRVLSAEVEGKGQVYQALADHLAANSEVPDYVALIDAAVLLSTSSINRLLHLAASEGLDVCAPALSHDSSCAHRWSLRQASLMFRELDWVEMTMPFYRGSLFMAGREQYRGHVSSAGMDCYLMPTLQQLTGLKRCVLVDAVMACHRPPAGQGPQVYRNGRSAGEEAAAVKAHCIALIQSRQPELLQSEWFRRLFEQGPARSRWQQVKDGLGRRLRRWLEAST
ncbi:hypothetical protein J7U46_02185 [Pelomonas sp. V22]|uniref:hypothetical protein n=1 Tax=Pelomonas sp. V22 TaxID=2822139 RepID=UPI0024A9F90D|nr:hypothetical protein [Pelomonas sp. V22]MDI4631849.1 hypothetical protein [Pelomonas sp. V22]